MVSVTAGIKRHLAAIWCDGIPHQQGRVMDSNTIIIILLVVIACGGFAGIQRELDAMPTSAIVVLAVGGLLWYLGGFLFAVAGLVALGLFCLAVWAVYKSLMAIAAGAIYSGRGVSRSSIGRGTRMALAKLGQAIDRWIPPRVVAWLVFLVFFLVFGAMVSMH
jgi:hypothetical protein